jgi:single-strand DNA-binding protein
MYHKIVIAGYLGRDPEMRYTPQGTPVTNFSVAASRRWTNADGTRGEETVWFRVTAWRRLAETCNQYLSKGQPVLVEGRLRPDPETGGPRIWTGQDGVARASFEINALDIRFLGRRDEGIAAIPEEGEVEMEEEGIPF